MIRINLFPIKKKKKKKRKPAPVPGFLIATVLLILAICVGSFYFYIAIKDEIRNLQTKRGANEMQIKELKNQLKALTNYEGLIKSIEEKKSVIVQLRKNQDIPVSLLDELSVRLPEGVWLKEFLFQGKGLNIEGYAFSNSDVVKYVNNLKESKLFDIVYLSESKQESITEKDVQGSIPVYSFKLLLSVKV